MAPVTCGSKKPGSQFCEAALRAASRPGHEASFDYRNMLCNIARRRSVKARVVRDLDLLPERTEAGALIERQRRRMIERAGVHPDARDLPRPSLLQRAIHQPAPGAAANQVS